MNAALSQLAGRAMMGLTSLRISLDDRDAFTDAVAAAADYEALPAFAKDLLARAEREMERLRS